MLGNGTIMRLVIPSLRNIDTVSEERRSADPSWIILPRKRDRYGAIQAIGFRLFANYLSNVSVLRKQPEYVHRLSARNMLRTAHIRWRSLFCLRFASTANLLHCLYIIVLSSLGRTSFVITPSLLLPCWLTSVALQL